MKRRMCVHNHVLVNMFKSSGSNLAVKNAEHIQQLTITIQKMTETVEALVERCADNEKRLDDMKAQIKKQ